MIANFFNKSKKKLYLIVTIFFISNIVYNVAVPMIKGDQGDIKLSEKVLENRKFDFVFGDSKATNKLLIYGDFSCHACAFTYKMNIEKIKKLLDAKKLQFVYRPVPMSMHSVQILNFIFGESFSEEERFKLLSLVYENSTLLYEKNSKEQFKELFKRNNIKTDRFDELSNQKKPEVLGNMQNAITDGVKATPTIVLNKKIVDPRKLPEELNGLRK